MEHYHDWWRAPSGMLVCTCGQLHDQSEKEESMPDNAEKLGSYEDTSQFDHDTDMLVDGLLSELDARGVSGAAALASVRRSLKGRR